MKTVGIGSRASIENPDYNAAEYEMGYLSDRGVIEIHKPLRFKREDVSEAMEAFRTGDFETLNRLAVRPYIALADIRKPA